MPCTYTGSIDGDTIHFQSERIKKLEDELDKATRILCGLSQRADKLNIKLDGEWKDWWEKHQEQDKKRLEAEASLKASVKALKKQEADDSKRLAVLRKKLTKEELDLLKRKG